MPITDELKNIQKLESVGFNHKQAEALADIIEQAQNNGIESLKDFIRNEINGLELRTDTKFANMKADIANLKADIMTSQKDMLVKIFAIVFGISGMLFAMIKIFA